MKHLIDANAILKVCLEHSLSFEEVFLCYLLLFNKENGNSEFNKNFGEYYSKSKQVHDYFKMLEYLEEAGFIENHNQPNKFVLSKILVTDKAKKLLYGDSKHVTMEEAWQDVMSAYPKYMIVNSKRINARTSSNMIKLKQYYYTDVIKGSYLLHREFIELTLQKFGEHPNKDRLGTCDPNAVAEMGIEKFINSWDSNKELILDYLKNGSERVKSKIAY